jgi:hypothetical protein
VFAWSIHVEFKDGSIETLFGDVTLIR